MDHIDFAYSDHPLIGDVLKASRDADHERVFTLGEQILDSLPDQTDPNAIWLVQEALSKAAHAVDDYELMHRVARQMHNTARVMGRADHRISALLTLSTANRCLNELQDAVLLARQALEESSALPADSPLKAQCYQVLLAALVESGDPQAAWDFHTELADTLHLLADEQEQGKAYWTLGNLAFLVGEPQCAVRYHEQVAGLLVPGQDMLLWARFNRATTELRLQAGILDHAVRDSFRRAEIAFTIIKPGDLDLVGLCLTRSRLHAAEQDPGRARADIEDFVGQYDGNPTHLVPLLVWWATLLEQNNEPERAAEQRSVAAGLDRGAN